MTGMIELGARIGDRLRILGYWRKKRPDVARFCQEKGYRPQYVYAWLKGRIPGQENLARLAGDLEVSAAWLMFGEQALANLDAVSMGMAAGETPRPLGRPLAASRRPSGAGQAEAGPGARDARQAPPRFQVIDFAQLRDVTEKLVLLGAELDAIFRAFPDHFFWLDPQGTILDAKAGTGSGFPVPAEGLAGRHLLDVLPPEIAQPLHAAFEQALETNTLHAHEFTLPVQQEEHRYEARFVPLNGALPRDRKALGIIRDVTERTQAEKALRESRERQALILRSVPVALYTARPSGERETIWITENVERLTGFPAGRFIAHPSLWAERIHPDDRARVLGTHRAVPSGHAFQEEYRWQSADGTYRWFLDQAVPVRDAGGTPREIVGTMLDITERRRAEEHARALVEVGKLICETVDLDGVLRLVIEKARELLDAPAASVFLIEGGEGGVIRRLLQSRGLPAGAQEATRLAPGEGLVGRAIQERSTVWTADILSDPSLWLSEEARRWFSTDEMPRAILAAPLLRGERVIGGLAVLRPAGAAFEPDEVQLLTALASQAAIAIENARLFREEQRRRRQLEAVRTVAEEVTRELNLSVLLDLIHRRAMELVGAATGMLFLWDETAQVLTPQAWSGGEWMREVQYRLGEGVTGTAAQRRRGMLVNEYRTSPHANPLLLERTAIAAALAEPLLCRDRLLGVITLNKEGPGAAFTDQDRETLAFFAAQAAVAIENARLYQDEQRRARDLAFVMRAARTITASSDPQRVLESTVQAAHQLTGAPLALLHLVGEEGWLIRRAVAGPLRETFLRAAASDRIPVSGSLAGDVATRGQSLQVVDPAAEGGDAPAELDSRLGLRWYVGVPILAASGTLGVLSIRGLRGAGLQHEHMSLLEALASLAAGAMERALAGR